LLPLRHAEMGANMNNSNIAADGFGTSVTQMHMFHAMDRLGIAQYLSRIGLLLDDGGLALLAEAKQRWLDDPAWQGLRRYVEDSLVLRDWFELTWRRTWSATACCTRCCSSTSTRSWWPTGQGSWACSPSSCACGSPKASAGSMPWSRPWLPKARTTVS
jgi:hypothetical protein